MAFEESLLLDSELSSFFIFGLCWLEGDDPFPDPLLIDGPFPLLELLSLPIIEVDTFLKLVPMALLT